MSQKLLFLLAGLALGAAAVLAVTALGASDPGKSDDNEIAKLRATIDDLEGDKKKLAQDLDAANLARESAKNTADAEIRALEEKIAAIATEAVPAPIVPEAFVDPDRPPTEAEVKAAVQEFGGAFQSIMLGGGEDAVAKLREFFERMGPAEMQKLVEEYETTSNMNWKLLLAHALAQSGRADAIETLAVIAKDQTRGFYDRRFAAHGLAFTDDPAAPRILLDIARSDPDRGVRANASFGLARNGSEEGVRIYAAATDEAFEKKDPVALQYLSGFALLGEKALPVIRERLEKYTDPQSRLVLIELVRSQKDRDSLPALQRLAGDPEGDQSVREEAEKAIRFIQNDGD